jgi:hypothetical protein
MGRLWRWSYCCVGILLVGAIATLPALAQFEPNPYYGLYPPSRLPSVGEVFGRFAIDFVSALLGFLVGAFFSPLLRPFRRIIFFASIASIAIYSWLGYAPTADWLTRIIAIFAFFVALGYGLQLGAKAILAAQEAATSRRCRLCRVDSTLAP